MAVPVRFRLIVIGRYWDAMRAGKKLIELRPLKMAKTLQARLEEVEAGGEFVIELEEFSCCFMRKLWRLGDGQFYRGFGGYWVFWFLGCR